MASSRPTLTSSLQEVRACLARAEATLEERGILLDLHAALDRALHDAGGAAPDARRLPSRSAEEERLSRVDAEAGQRRLAFAHEASKVLFDSPLDARLRLQSFARVVVPDLADWCFCDLAVDGGLERVAVASWNPAHAELTAQMLGARPPGENSHARVVLDAGQPVYAPDGDSLSFGPPGSTLTARSLMAFPLRARGRLLGVVTLAFADSNRRYDETDRALAEDLTQRAAMAVENAFLVADLERSIRARDELVGIVSHDLRSPLSTIRMAASLLTEDLGETVVKGGARVAMIMRATKRMEALVRDLLDVTALEGGGFTLDVSPQPAAPLVDDAIELFQAGAGQRKIDLVSTVERGNQIQCDPERVIQVLSNLVGNALKFTPDGGTITISSSLEGGFCRFAVTDTGAGIGPLELAQVFDRFYQGKRKAREGAGLGLSIVKGIVQAHGGTVSVTSTVGQGTSFSFTLPLSTVA